MGNVLGSETPNGRREFPPKALAERKSVQFPPMNINMHLWNLSWQMATSGGKQVEYDIEIE